MDITGPVLLYRGRSEKYERYYFGTWVSGRSTIIGTFIASGRRRGSVHIESSVLIPHIQDGGCIGVRISFDVATQRQIGASCDGVA